MCDHTVTAVELTWNRCLILAEYFLPAKADLPEFDTVGTCTAEQEVLLKKIVNLIPTELDPKHRRDEIQDYLLVNWCIVFFYSFLLLY